MRLRPGTSRDVATFTRLVNAQYRWLRGEDEWQEDELGAILISPTGEPAVNDRYVEVDGHAVAAVHVHIGPPFTKGTVRIALPPGDQRATYARTLLNAAERILASHPKSPVDAYLQMDVPREDEQLREVAEQLGYHVAQKVTILEGEILDAPAPDWPHDVDAATFSVTRDLRDGFAVVSETLQAKRGGWHLSWEDYEYNTTNDPTALPGLSVIVRDRQGSLGMALNFMDTSRERTGLIGVLGVRERRRGEGIGRALLLESFERFRSRGWSHARIATVAGMDLGDDDYSLYTGVGLAPLYDDLVMVKDR